MNATMPRSKALITGASTGIGAVYAHRLALRGYDVVLVARDGTKLEALAGRLGSETESTVEILVADLTDKNALLRVEQKLREDKSISLLINNAGAVQHGSFLENADLEEQEQVINLNVLALSRLIASVLPRFSAKDEGAIVNIASVVALAPGIRFGLYGATKAYVLALSQSLQDELTGTNIYVQAVLPGATRTEIWERSGRDVSALKTVMHVEEMVDAALIGFDQKELITIPALEDVGSWDAYDSARKAVLSMAMSAQPALRYRS